MIWLSAILTISSASAAWTDSPRYASSYRFARCIPCEQRQENTFPQSNGLEYRGNGADNLGYDWSPKAWGGRAFPSKDDGKGQFGMDDWNNRDGRRMPWNEKCRDCDKSKTWGQYGDSKGNNNNQYGDRNSPTFKQDSWGASTDRPQSYVGNSAGPTDGFSTVTSSVLGVRLRDDKRLPVEWSQDSRSMRWDGFRNGMPLNRPDSMDRRDDSFRPWEGNNQGSSSWNQDKKAHYASDWNYGDRNSEMSRPSSFDQRPWANRWSNINDGQYNQGTSSSGHQFGSSFPNTDRYPNSPSYSTTSSYPTSNRPPEYPAGSSPNNNRPTYQTTSNPYPYKPQSESATWNYRPDHQPWTTSRPQQSYLPQNNRPPNKPDYSYGQTNNKPYAGTPGTAIWHGRPNDRPSDSSQRPQGFYTGFITEIHDPKYSGNGNRYPSDSPISGGGYDKNNNDRYPGNSIQGTRFPSYNGNNYGTNYDRYPNQKPGYESPYDGYKQPTYAGNVSPSYDGNRHPGYDGNRNPTYDGNRNPTYDGNRNPSYGGNRSPSYDGNRKPSYDGNRNPNYDSNRNPSNDGNKNFGYSGNSHDSRPNRYPETNNNDNRNPNSGYDYQNSYPDSNSNRDRDRDWNYGSDHRDYGQSSYNNDRDTRIPYGSSASNYPSRPNSGDHDRGPNSGSVSGSWNYGDEDKEGSYRRSGGSYPLYKGGQYFTSSYLASASTPAAAAADPPYNKSTDETTISSSQE